MNIILKDILYSWKELQKDGYHTTSIYKKSYCKKCKLPYKNERIRIKNGLVIITCPNCGDVRRIPIKN